jgi:hypothetical protein
MYENTKKTVNPALFICVVDKTALKTEKNEKNEKQMIFTCDFHK